MSEIKIEPAKVKVGGIEWSMDEVRRLKDIFNGKDEMDFDKREVRANDLLQKALASEVILQYGDLSIDDITLVYSKTGKELREFV